MFPLQLQPKLFHFAEKLIEIQFQLLKAFRVNKAQHKAIHGNHPNRIRYHSHTISNPLLGPLSIHYTLVS